MHPFDFRSVETEATFDNFLAETLAYLATTRPASRPGLLLLLDGFERALWAYRGGLGAAYQGDAETPEGSGRGCVSPLAEAFLGGVGLRGFKAKKAKSS